MGGNRNRWHTIGGNRNGWQQKWVAKEWVAKEWVVWTNDELVGGVREEH